MSYTSFGQVPSLASLTAGKFPMDQAQAQAKSQARSMWVGQGNDPRLFDLADNLVSGVVSGVSAGQSPGSALVHMGVQAAQAGVQQIDPQSLSDATGIPAPIIALAQDSIARGSLPSTDQTLTVAGSAAGLAVCTATGAGAVAAPLCGAIGGLVGHLLSGPVNSVADDVTHMFGGTTADEVARIQADVHAKNDLSALMHAVMQAELDVVDGVVYGLARFYNNALSLGVQLPAGMPPSASRDEMRAALMVGFFDEDYYRQKHGGNSPDDTIRGIIQNFNDAVGKAVDQKYSHQWSNDQIESGFVRYVRHYIFLGGIYDANNFQYFPRGGTDPVSRAFADQFAAAWPNGCSWSGLFGPFYTGETSNVACEGNGLIQNPIGQPFRMPCDAQMQLSAWQCHLSKHLSWFLNVAPQFGRQWADVASRSVALILYKQKKALMASAAAARAKAAAAAARAASDAATRQLATASLVAATTGQQQRTTEARRTAVATIGVAAAAAAAIIAFL